MEFIRELNQILSPIEVHSYTSAGCVVIHENMCLVIITDRGYEFPKGKIDEGEEPQEAAIRETKEETGVICKIKDSTKISVINRKRKKMAFFEAEYISGKAGPSHEAENGIYDARWVPIRKVKKVMKKNNFYQLEVLEQLL